MNRAKRKGLARLFLCIAGFASSPSSKAMTLTESFAVGDRFESVMKSDYEKQGLKPPEVVISLQFPDPDPSHQGIGVFNSETDNSRDMPSLQQRVITVYTNAESLKAMTADVMLFVLCHEAGHNLGGAPLKLNPRWEGVGPFSAAEGQADYFATHSCIDHFIGEFGFPDDSVADEEISKKCKRMANGLSTTADDIDRCRKSVWADFNQLKFFADINLNSKDAVHSYAEFSALLSREPEPFPNGIMEEHPAADCRLETYIAGSVGAPRPKCWYNP